MTIKANRKIVSVSLNKKNWENFQDMCEIADIPASRLMDLLIREYIGSHKESLVKMFQGRLDEALESEKPWVLEVAEAREKKAKKRAK